MTANTQLLRDPETAPSDQVLEEALGEEVFNIYQHLANHTIPHFELALE